MAQTLEHALQAVDNQRFAALRFQVAGDSTAWPANQATHTVNFTASHEYLASVGVLRIDPADALRALGLQLTTWSWGPITFRASQSGATGMPARDYDVEAGRPSNALFAMPKPNTPTVMTFALAGTPPVADTIFIAGLRPADDAEERVGAARQVIKKAESAVKKVQRKRKAGLLTRASRFAKKGGRALWSGIRKLIGVEGLGAFESAGVSPEVLGEAMADALGDYLGELDAVYDNALGALASALGEALDAIDNPSFIPLAGEDWLGDFLGELGDEDED